MENEAEWPQCCSQDVVYPTLALVLLQTKMLHSQWEKYVEMQNMCQFLRGLISDLNSVVNLLERTQLEIA